MSEMVSPASAPLSGGAMLRQAREAAGLHIGALAVSLRVPVRKLEALEADHFDQLPDMVFVRALAASVCRALNIDSTAVLAQLPQTSAPHLRNDEAGINVPFRGGASATGSILGDSFSRPYVLLGLVLLVGVVVLAVLTFFDRVPGRATSRDEAIAPTVLTSALETSPASAALAASSAVTAASAASGVASAPGAIVEGSGLSTGTLVLRVRGPSWVEVVDATGVVQLRRVLQPGETVGVSGVAPLSVVVGRADLTEVQVYGKPFDLNPIARDNVARFEVKP